MKRPLRLFWACLVNCVFLALVLAVFAICATAAGGPQRAANRPERAAVTETAKTGAQESITLAGQADDSYRYYPAYAGNVLYLKAFKKSEPGKQLFVKIQVMGIEKKEDGDYFFFNGPKVNIKYLMGIDKKNGIYLRVIKYPFPFFGISLKVDLKPKIQILKFPLKVGDKWHYEGKAEARLLIIPIRRDIKADFEVVERINMKTEVGDIDTYHLKAVMDLDDGKGAITEHYWYAKDIGYSIADTSGHSAEITGYRIFNEREGKWVEKLPENPEKYQ